MRPNLIYYRYDDIAEGVTLNGNNICYVDEDTRTGDFTPYEIAERVAYALRIPIQSVELDETDGIVADEWNHTDLMEAAIRKAQTVIR